MTSGVALVAAFALATALATGLGALPFALVRGNLDRWLGIANAVASGVMLGASASLLLEGGTRGGIGTAAGAAAGGLFVVATYRALGTHEALTLGSLSGLAARQALLIVVVMTTHSAAEGIGVGAAFGDGKTFGALIALAIAVQNVPEGLAISLVLVPRGATVRECGQLERLLKPAPAVTRGTGVPLRGAFLDCPAGRHSASPPVRWCGWSPPRSCRRRSRRPLRGGWPRPRRPRSRSCLHCNWSCSADRPLIPSGRCRRSAVFVQCREWPPEPQSVG